MAVAAMSRLGLYGLRQDLSAIMTLLQQAEAVEVEAAEGETSTLEIGRASCGERV